MTSLTPSQEAANAYHERLAPLYPKDSDDITAWPGYLKMKKFMVRDRRYCEKPPQLSIFSIPGGSKPSSKAAFMPPEGGPWSLLDSLPSLADSNPSSHLIIVENICPHTLAVLGGTYDIDPQFFAEHVNVLSWYKMYEKVPERLPSLPSTRKKEDFLIFKFVETREIEYDDGRSFVFPDKKDTRVRHSAGILEPISSQGIIYSRMAFTRQTVSVWCKQKTNGNGWIAIMLLNPPFKSDGGGRVGPSEYRSPSLRPKAGEKFHGSIYKNSFRHAFSNFLEQRCLTDEMYRKTCATDIFPVLYEGYRIASSEWLVVNEYVKRQLANIERQLEQKDSTFQELERHLKELYRIRRRCNKDYELVTETATQCAKRGQALWPSSKPEGGNEADAFTFVESQAQELEEDLKYVLDDMSINTSRIEKDINLLIGLVALGEGRQGIQENRGVALLTLVAIIFLPSETVATILGIQTQYGPGASNFWILWAIALPLTVLVVAFPSLYSIASAILNRLRVRYFHLKEDTTSREPHVPDEEGFEPVSVSDPWQHQGGLNNSGVV